MTPKVQYCLYNIQSMGVENIQGEDGEGLFQELDSIIANKATKSAAAGNAYILLDLNLNT